MKKLVYFAMLLSAGLLTQCKKNADIVVTPGPGTGTKPDPDIETPNTPLRFLKALNVTGAEKVDFDSASSTYNVIFPENFVDPLAEVKLSLYENVTIIGDDDNPIQDSVLKYKYAGTEPLRIRLKDSQDRHSGPYTVNFIFTGTPKIELLKKEFLVGRNGFDLPVRIISGLGTIYSGAEDLSPVFKAINRKTGFSTQGSAYSGFSSVYFEDAIKLVGNDPIVLEVHFKKQKPVVFEGIKFIRDAPIVTMQPSYKFIYSQKDTLMANGGYFLEHAKYTVRFSNDHGATPVTMALKFDDEFELTAKQLPNLPEGSYLMSFYEDDKVIGKDVIYVSETAKKGIETIWQGEPGLVTVRNLDAISYKKGDSFYAKQSPPDFVGINGTGDISKLPLIRLKNGTTSIDLKPEMIVFNWSIAGIAIPFGKYTIPSDFPSGSYEVIGVFKDSETKPYWSKLQVR